MEQYLSIQRRASAEIVEKKSRFICSLKPVTSEEEAVAFVREISEAHKDASHNVYAYIVIDKIEIQKASDDGEPQGTAGIPILELIKKGNLKNICIVVTRYFGGILLGAGGLVRAYSGCAKLGIEEAKVCKMCLYRKISVKADYTYLGKLQNIITNMGNNIINIEYTEVVCLIIKSKFNNVDNTVNAIVDATRCSAIIELGEQYFDIDI